MGINNSSAPRRRRHGHRKKFVAAFLSIPHSWINSCNIDLDPAICSGGRRPRSTVDGGRRQRSAKGRDRRRPKAGVGACRASRARTRAEAPIQVRTGPFDPPLCVSPLVCPSDAMLLPSSAIRHAMAPLRPAQVPCRLNDYNCNRNQVLPPTSVRYFWAQEQQPFPGASQRRSLPGNAHPAPLSPSTSTSLSRPL